MGLLIDGVWHDRWYDTGSTGGAFVREASKFRNWVTPDGRPGPTGTGGFTADAGRYHLYVSYACPWAHRTLIMRRLKGLEDVIGVSVVKPHMLENGWEYAVTDEGTTDAINGFRYHHQLYTAADPHYSGRATVPVLWDRNRGTIVSNESADIIRMLNASFQRFAESGEDYYPVELRDEINAINSVVYEDVNNGVYRCGFATTQHAYEEAFDRLFERLDAIEELLSRQRYLVGGRLTEADWRLFTTLVRFDAVYYSHFKCNMRRIDDYPELSNYLRELFQHAGVADTVYLDHIKQHYYFSHKTVNPTRIVPKGPVLDFRAPHNRERFTAQ